MRINKKQDIIITKKQALELFLLLSHARLRINGKMQDVAISYRKELAKLLGLDLNENN